MKLTDQNWEKVTEAQVTKVSLREELKAEPRGEQENQSN